MRTHYVTVGLTLLLLTGVVVAADAKTQQVHCKGGGTFTTVETNIDTDGDGNSAGVDQGADVCNIGSFVFEEEIEVIPRPVTSACPAGTTDVPQGGLTTAADRHRFNRRPNS